MSHNRGQHLQNGGAERLWARSEQSEVSNGLDQNERPMEKGREEGTATISAGRDGGDLPFSE